MEKTDFFMCWQQSGLLKWILIQKKWLLIIAYTIYRQYNKNNEMISRNEKSTTFESEQLYENNYENKVS